MSTYIDSNIFLYPIIYEETIEGVLEAKSYLLQIAKGELNACTASLTWDEIVWVVRKYIDPDTSKIKGEQFLIFPHLKILDVDFNIIQKAHELLEVFHIKPRDAIHAASALNYNCTDIISDDQDFEKVKGLIRIPLHEE